MGSGLASVHEGSDIEHRFDGYEPVGNLVAVAADVPAEEVIIASQRKGRATA